MKTSKAKTISKTKKPPKSGIEVKKKKVTVGKSKPSEEEIREKAMERTSMVPSGLIIVQAIPRKDRL